ncbi:MAG TPA: [protein-PII] uridylyltransferase [Mycobacteriales bacterium]|nr:[protein-PII] uridylyltransferase [Mycobacteriales bacterium]
MTPSERTWPEQVRDTLARYERPVSLRQELTGLYEHWLARLLPPASGVALVAVGSLARGEVMPHGDIDLIIVHNGRKDIGAIADRVWYPLWDAGVAVDHSVRTVPEALKVAREDIAVTLGLLSARSIAGDADLANTLRARIREQWRRSALKSVEILDAAASERAERHGDLAFLIEPDLKQCRGGLRDIAALQALAIGQLTDPVSGVVRAAARLLLDVRVELHRRSGRALDRLVQQEQGAIARSLGFADADQLLQAVSDAGRTIAFTWNDTVRRVDARPRKKATRRPLADGVVEQAGEVVLARGAAPAADPALLIRVAAAAAAADLPIAPFTVRRLEGVSLPDPWPEPARRAFIALLAAGRPAITVLEAFDRAGILLRIFPEWQQVRSRPQRDPVHRFTVDRHLMETAAGAAARLRDVRRPDLLLMTALLHDIGKGSGTDHSIAGVPLATAILRRMGFAPVDVDLVAAAVRHHLLLPDTATRRDLDDPATIAGVTETLGGSADLLEILHVLAHVDGAATGPAAWGAWKAGLVDDLARRTQRRLGGAPVEPAPKPPPAAGPIDGGIGVLVEGDRITCTGADGILSSAAGVLALHRLEVVAATVVSDAGREFEIFSVVPPFGEPPDAARLRADLHRARSGSLDLDARLRAVESAYPAGDPAPAVVSWFDDAATDATVVELRAPNARGLLFRVTSAFDAAGVRVRAARVSTWGTAVVDAFYLENAAGGPITDPGRRQKIEAAIRAAAGPSA